MNFDFSKFLLDCTQRFYLKTSDIVSLLISTISIFVAIIAIIISLQLQLWIVLSLFGLDAFGLIVIPYIILKNKLKKNNEKIFKIEKIIIKNYECMNKRDDEIKNCILEEFNRVLREKNQDDAKLIELLSKPCKDLAPILNTKNNF